MLGLAINLAAAIAIGAVTVGRFRLSLRFLAQGHLRALEGMPINSQILRLYYPATEYNIFNFLAMARKKYQASLVSWGIYEKWDKHSKALPRLLEMTRKIPCEVDVEFGYIVNIKKAKNKKLYYCIYHPDITDKKGRVLAPFDGEEYIRQNDWNFFIGDTIWSPIENKEGNWRITLAIENQIIADETFQLLLPIKNLLGQ